MSQIRGTSQIIAGTVTQAQLGLTDPINPLDAVTYRVLLALSQGRTLKYPCRVTTNGATDVPFASSTGSVLTTSGNVTTLDGVTLAVGDRVLLRSYVGANAAYNGIYTVNSLSGTSQFVRAADANTSGSNPAASSDVVMGMLVPVSDGALNAGTEWTLVPASVGASQAVTLNTTQLVFSKIGMNGGASANFVTRETPSGTVNGSNTGFTLAHTPVGGSEQIFLNGLLLNAGPDYSISGASITTASPPLSADTLLATYRY